MVFITAGMGGGTGTGAAPVIARVAREAGILTVGVVTKPFHFEGTHRMRLAEAGIEELQKFVDTLIIIPNQNLFRVANERTTFADAFKMADDVLHSGVRGVTDLMVMPGLINLDFADIRTVMSEMGKAMMGTGEAEGDRRAIDAAEAAISNPLLDDVSMKGARGVLINITGGLDMTLFEVDEAANRIREEVDPDANIIFGSTFDETLAGKMRISVVATGIDALELGQEPAPRRRSVVAPHRAPATSPRRSRAGAYTPADADARTRPSPSRRSRRSSRNPSGAEPMPAHGEPLAAGASRPKPPASAQRRLHRARAGRSRMRRSAGADPRSPSRPPARWPVSSIRRWRTTSDEPRPEGRVPSLSSGVTGVGRARIFGRRAPRRSAAASAAPASRPAAARPLEPDERPGRRKRTCSTSRPSCAARPTDDDRRPRASSAWTIVQHVG